MSLINNLINSFSSNNTLLKPYKRRQNFPKFTFQAGNFFLPSPTSHLPSRIKRTGNSTGKLIGLLKATSRLLTPNFELFKSN